MFSGWHAKFSRNITREFMIPGKRLDVGREGRSCILPIAKMVQLSWLFISALIPNISASFKYELPSILNNHDRTLPPRNCRRVPPEAAAMEFDFNIRRIPPVHQA